MLELNRIYCGDCLKVMKDIPDGSVDLVLCDLPYGTTQNKWDSVIDLNLLWKQYTRICKKSAAIVLTAQTPFDKILGTSNLQNLKYEWIWEKEHGTGFLNSKKMPLKNHENILVFYATPPQYNPQMRLGYKKYFCRQGGVGDNYGIVKPENISKSNGERFPLSVLKFQRDNNKKHPTQKPVSLFEYLINTYTNKGDLVLDNCIRSGTTAVACRNLNRNFIGIEKEQKYVDIANQRIKNAEPQLF